MGRSAPSATQHASTGFRMTRQRRAVLEAVRGHAGHPSAEDIRRAVERTSPGVGLATVYRTLHLLVEHGYLSELRLGDQSVVRYDANMRRHDHVVCTGCGATFDVEVALPATVIEAAAAQAGAQIETYGLQFQGLCGSCGS